MAGKVVGCDGYATHQVMLVKYLSIAPEDALIAELGCGFYSIPLIDSIASVRKLRARCYYQDKDWQKKIEPLCPNTEFIHVDNWNRWKLEDDCFLAMLDNEELVVNRYKQIDRSLFLWSSFILVHDADIYPKRGINIRDEFHVEYFDGLVPHTAVIETSLGRKDPTDHEKPSEAREECLAVPEVDPSIKTAVVCCFAPGGDYDSNYLEYIRRLADGVEEHTTGDVDFFCSTIMTLDSIPNVKQINPEKKNWQGWHCKADIFREGLWDGYDRVLYVDLDTVITGNIDDIITSSSEFSMLHDFYHPAKQETGVIYFNPKLTTGLYTKFSKKQPRRTTKDADIINQWLRSKKIKPLILQDYFKIGSYKVSIIRDQKPSGDYQIICFHGNPRPHHVGWNLSLDKNENISRKAMMNMARQPVKNKIAPVQPCWDGEDVYVIGGGPSLRGLDLDHYLTGKRVLGVNDGYLYDCCEVCYFGDTVWFHHHNDGIKRFNGEIYSTAGVPDPTIHHLNCVGVGFSDDPTVLAWNSNSGMAGINLAALLGAKRIFLLGFDMNFGKEGESNWHDNIRHVNKNTYDVFLRREKLMAKELKAKFPELEVINVEAQEGASRMQSFQKILFDDLYKGNKTNED